MDNRYVNVNVRVPAPAPLERSESLSRALLGLLVNPANTDAG